MIKIDGELRRDVLEGLSRRPASPTLVDGDAYRVKDSAARLPAGYLTALPPPAMSIGRPTFGLAEPSIRVFMISTVTTEPSLAMKLS